MGLPGPGIPLNAGAHLLAHCGAGWELAEKDHPHSASGTTPSYVLASKGSHKSRRWMIPFTWL